MFAQANRRTCYGFRRGRGGAACGAGSVGASGSPLRACGCSHGSYGGARHRSRGIQTADNATLLNNYIYWTMHVTTFGAALLLWHALLARGAKNSGAALAVAFGTGIQMSLLGAVLSLAPRPMFLVHLTTTWPWGLSPLQDQELGGVILWVPAGILFTI